MRLSSLLAVFLLVPSMALAGSINRNTKTGAGCVGTTAWQDGCTLTAADLNADFDTLYNDYANNITAVNLATGSVATEEILNATILNEDVSVTAAIQYIKMEQTAAAQDADVVDDYSTDADEQDNSSTPGTSESPTLATNLQLEIEKLRYKLEQLVVGTSCSAVVAGGGTDTAAGACSWIDGPVRGHNLLYNGGFDVINTLTVSVAGDGWTPTASNPDTLAADSLDRENQGPGQGLNVIAGAGDTNEGVTQTLSGLKADTRYLAIVAARPDVATCSLSTTGADTNQLTVTSSSGTNTWEILSGTFETDSTPTPVVIQLLAVDNSSDCVFDHAAVYEINTDPVPRNGGVLIAYDNNGAVGAGAATGPVADSSRVQISGISSLAVTIPGPGYIIEVVGGANIDWTGSDPAESCVLYLEEVGTGDRASASNTAARFDVVSQTTTLQWVDTSPTPGTTYTFALDLEDGGNAAGTQCRLNANDYAWLSVKAYPAGVQ